MPQNYFNNNDRPITNVYSPVFFGNPNSRIQATSFSISYFNRLMCIKIAEKIPDVSGGAPKYNNDAAIKIYVSVRQAKLLHDAIKDMLETGKNNVNIETNKGMLQVSNGAEYGSDTPCIVIFYTLEGGGAHKAIYQMNNNDKVAYNFSDGTFSEMTMASNYELDTFLMILEEYWKASSYAQAWAVKEASAYSDKRTNDLMYAIATKIGARTVNTNGQQGGAFLSGGGGYNSNNGNYNNSGSASGFSGAPQGYEESSFDDIVNSMGNYTE